ncbi:hypothetical protein O3P69_009844 [Scylla paramamosain]|uniref:Uncharacterized protein n=1 Tax=Scylla paramamosain TaxID=85552 RepID=A0AAW0SMV1_SCYPA
MTDCVLMAHLHEEQHHTQRLRSMKCYFGHKCSSVHSATCMSNLAGRCGRSTGASYTRVKWMNWPRSGVGRGAQGWGVR